MYRIIETVPGRYALASDAGDLAITTASETFVTSDRALAEEAERYLNQPRAGLDKRRGSRRMKSMFGVL